MSGTEVGETFDCFGCGCTVHVGGDAPAGSAAAAASRARELLLGWHGRFSRFLPDSELSQLNRDPRATVPATPLMLLFAAAVRRAGALSGGLVDATLVRQIEQVGYASDLPRPLPLHRALANGPPRRPARPSPERRWRTLETDGPAGAITRPPGVMLDSGGLAKGLCADVLAVALSEHASLAVDLGGDLALGGRAGVARTVEVESPFDGGTLHAFRLHEGGVATSGIGRRSWLDGSSRPAHHLLDPASGCPAFTGVVQATALAPSALLAEIRAKAAVLSGPRAAPDWLVHGGVLVFDDGSHRVVQPPPRPTAAALASHRAPSARDRATAAACGRGIVGQPPRRAA